MGENPVDTQHQQTRGTAQFDTLKHFPLERLFQAALATNNDIGLRMLHPEPKLIK